MKGQLEASLSSPLVTVLIATYNKSSTLRYAIESVLWQTFEDFELWVVGDGCTDDSEQVVTSFTDPRVNWCNLPVNTGYQSIPHNEGLRRANGEYIAYLNHDDIWMPNHLQVLVDCLENPGVDFAYTIMEWILTWQDDYARLLPWREDYADIPIYPNAPLPPEASVTMHRKDVVDEIGYWKVPEETYAVPRADYFRRAQFIDNKFELVPFLTVLKFAGSSRGYSLVGQQPEYMERIIRDPDFIHRELGSLLTRAYDELERPITFRRLLYQLKQEFRRFLVRRKVDPARVVFWRKPGRHIRQWYRDRQLD